MFLQVWLFAISQSDSFAGTERLSLQYECENKTHAPLFFPFQLTIYVAAHRP